MKDRWDKSQIIASCIGAIAIPVILCIMGISLQKSYKDKEISDNRLELFMNHYTELISKDSIERKTALIVIRELAYHDSTINSLFVEILSILKVYSNEAPNSLQQIFNDKKSSIPLKKKAEEILYEITDSVQIIPLTKLPEGTLLSPKFDGSRNLWSLHFDKISEKDLKSFEENFITRETYVYLLRFNQKESTLELLMRPPWTCRDIEISTKGKPIELIITFTHKYN